VRSVSLALSGRFKGYGVGGLERFGGFGIGMGWDGHGTVLVVAGSAWLLGGAWGFGALLHSFLPSCCCYFCFFDWHMHVRSVWLFGVDGLAQIGGR